MQSRIIFFDDEPQTNRRLRDSLEKQGYLLCVPKTVEEAFHEINVNKAELLVHGAHKTETFWKICDAVFKQYPNFPSIHFATGPSSEINHDKLRGPFHWKVRHLGPERLFLKRVRKLIFMGRMARENTALKRAIDLQNRIDTVFDTLDLQDLKTHVVNFFAKEFKASNAFFLSPGGYGYYLQEMWKVAPFSPHHDIAQLQRHSFVAAQPATEENLSSFLARVADKLPNGWEMRKQRTFVDIDKKGEGICFVPLFGHQSKRILGHVMLVNPLLYGDRSLEKVFPHLTKVFGRHLEHVTSFADAKSLSYIDDLTDLYNQRYLKLILDKEISRCQRANQAFSVLFMDIDHFKQVNDTRGHLIGSKVLVELSKILHQNIRTADYGFRYGGDEFLLILVNTDSKAALHVAERIRQQVESSTFDCNGAKIKVTLSIGIATFPEHATTKEQIIELADRAMYCGKEKSRNIVYVAS
jgi:diguanylate cyclase (GGDEF)-like protein